MERFFPFSFYLTVFETTLTLTIMHVSGFCQSEDYLETGTMSFEFDRKSITPECHPRPAMGTFKILEAIR